jgi:Flp pilus assembly protein TadD
MDGVLALWGERVTASPSRGDASVYDIAPTILALLGLPVDPKMSGQPLLADFHGVEAPPRRDLYGAVEVRRLPASAPSAAEADEYARKLRSLGYLSGSESKSVPTLPEGPWPGRTEGAWNNLGILQRESGSLQEADRSFQEALKIRPDYASPMFNLAGLRRTQGRWEEARTWLFRSFDAGHAEPEQTVLQWATDAAKAGKRREAVSLLENAVSRYPRSEVLAVALARLRFEAKDCAGAVAALSAFSETGGREASNVLGLSELCLGNAARARGLLERSLSLDPAQPPIREAVRMIDAGK